jgi:hypothetical protein
MLRQFVLSQIVLATAMFGTFGGAVGGDEQAPDVATWRWHVTGILEAQRGKSPGQVTIGAYDFRQRYERYAPNGMPEAPAHAPAK